jgi:pimeloyl-ACP methyl ester carboxylesterase
VVVLVVALVVTAAASSAAEAAVPFRLCPRLQLPCATVHAPIDYSGGQPGQVPLFVVRVPARHPSQGTVVALAGGPGQAAVPLVDDFIDELRPVLRHHDLIVFDQRGTGRSGLLRCPRSKTGPPDIGADVEACAAALGPRRAFYTAWDAAEDIETVRRAVGVERIAVFGTSYGSKVALAYAQRHPASVDRLLLDSVVPLDGPDPLMTDIFHAVPRSLRDLCEKNACRRIASDPVGDLAALVAKMAAGPLRGYAVGGDGRRRARHLGRARFLTLLVDGDLDPSVRSEFPAAVRAALRGDTAPLLRLAHRDEVTGGFERPQEFSTALYAAATCAEGVFPWNPAASFSDRWDAVGARLASIPDASFFPFDRATAQASDTLRLCAHWPRTDSSPMVSRAALPDVPTLILSGEDDLRTPSENAAGVAAQLPRATHLIVRGVGHSVLGNDLSLCAARAVRLFFADQPVASSCPHLEDLPFDQLEDVVAGLEILQAFSPTPIPPASLSDVPRASGVRGRAGRTLSAAELTLIDVTTQQFFRFGDNRPIGGLRSGRTRANGALDRYSFVPGVAVSEKASRALFRPVERVRVSGKAAAHGVLVFNTRKNRITGRLGARRIRVRFFGQLRQLFRDLDKVAPIVGDSRCCHYAG